MAFLLMMLMVFHAIGALVFIPAMVSLLRPRFAIVRGGTGPHSRPSKRRGEAASGRRSDARRGFMTCIR